MRPNKKVLNDYPPHGQEMSIFQFMLYREQGLPQVIRYFNGWLTGINEPDGVLVVRYEDMRKQPQRGAGAGSSSSPARQARKRKLPTPWILRLMTT